MVKKIKKYKQSSKNESGKQINREELEQAIKKYLENGGTISRVEPDWIEEGQVYCFDNDNI
ncbi:MAG: hypothetical protein HOD92_25630 [Deltaproteobacteria bacterium]|jgi:hypothetical protein|nr:hypothetical protein [Deltaproteobacteria bacterium]MBT4525442.1 hypothetical protein [Deltaproteobacteria bacterium]